MKSVMALIARIKYGNERYVMTAGEQLLLVGILVSICALIWFVIWWERRRVQREYTQKITEICAWADRLFKMNLPDPCAPLIFWSRYDKKHLSDSQRKFSHDFGAECRDIYDVCFGVGILELIAGEELANEWPIWEKEGVMKPSIQRLEQIGMELYQLGWKRAPAIPQEDESVLRKMRLPRNFRQHDR